MDSPLTQSATFPWAAVAGNVSPVQCKASHFLSESYRHSFKLLKEVPQVTDLSGYSEESISNYG